MLLRCLFSGYLVVVKLHPKFIKKKKKLPEVEMLAWPFLDREVEMSWMKAMTMHWISQ